MSTASTAIETVQSDSFTSSLDLPAGVTVNDASADNANCYPIVLSTESWGYEISWTLGSCGSNGAVYGDNQVIETQCCLPDGTYTLSCMDSYGDGWHYGNINID